MLEGLGSMYESTKLYQIGCRAGWGGSVHAIGLVDADTEGVFLVS